ncbi:MAG: FtsX-like permease family protein [Elusimicrobiota bacterium]
MKLILTIAWRNILRHKGKSLVIGVIIFLGALLMTIGNGVIAGMDEGIKQNIVNGFMGDIVIISAKQKSDNILLEMMGTAIEPISGYKKIKEVLKAQGCVDRFLPVGKNMAMVLNEEEAAPGFAYLLGVDFAAYQKMFPDNFKVIEGRRLRAGEKGLLVPVFAREELYNYTNIWLIPEGGTLVEENLSKDARQSRPNIPISNNIVLLGMSSGVNSSTDIRLGIKGVVKYPALNTIFGHFCLTDIESYRECLGYFSASETAVEVAKEEQKLLKMENSDLDSLFVAESIVMTTAKTRPKTSRQTVVNQEKVVTDVEDGVYNAVFVKLKEGTPYPTAIAGFNRAFTESACGVRAITWNKASGPIGSMTLIIKGVLFLFVTILFCVAIIIIVNTLTMAALERTPEIGMMRAIGAGKSFIAGMFLGETGILSFVFGGAGILLGLLLVKIIPLFRITSSNDLIQLLYGGDVFHPLLSIPDIALTVFQLIVVTVIAALYPVKVARNITPLEAIARD